MQIGKKATPEIYLNHKQGQLREAQQEFRVVVAGRGFGKTMGCIGPSLLDKLYDMPGAKGMLYSTTYKQLLQQTVPALVSFWTVFGYRKHIDRNRPGHFVIGRKPPNAWATPADPPEDYSNVITWWNGFTIVLVSLDRADLARGGSYQFLEGDEIALVPKHKLDDVLITTVRGKRNIYGKCPGYRQKSLYTSMPRKTSGQYVLNYADKATDDPEMFFYMEATSYDNIDVLGADTIESWRKTMSPMSFNIEVLNKRYMRAQKGAFYHRYNDQHHNYIPRHVYQLGGDYGYTVRDADCDLYKPLDASFDFGGWFNCATIYQKEGNVEYMRNAHHVYDNSSVDDLIDKICTEHADQQVKHINIHGDPRGHDRRAEGPTLYHRIRNRLHANGWSCTIVVQPTRTTNHVIRYEWMNEMFAETDKLLPKLRLNDETCKDVTVALNIALVKPDHTKDKKLESDHEYNQAHATHYTDTVDYFFMQKYLTTTHSASAGGEWHA